MATVVNTAIMAHGIIFLAGAVAGYLFVPIENIGVRILLACVAIFIIIPENITTIIGIPLGLAVLVFFFIRKKTDDCPGFTGGSVRGESI